MRKPTTGETGETVTTTVAFDRATYKQLRFLAVERDTNVRELIRAAVADYLKRQQGRKRS
jgi:predicted transcriptional regulator